MTTPSDTTSGSAPSRSSVEVTASSSYGGSRKTMSKRAPSRARRSSAARTSARSTRACPVTPSAVTFARSAPIARASRSTNVAWAAPRGPEFWQSGLPGPEELAVPAELQIDLGDAKAVVGLRHRAHSASRVLAELAVREQDAVRLPRPAAHPAAQLVQLREAEALGVLDEHHAGVRHVDADFDHGRGDEEVDLARLEAAHDPVFVFRREPAVEQPHRDVTERALLEP